MAVPIERYRAVQRGEHRTADEPGSVRPEPQSWLCQSHRDHRERHNRFGAGCCMPSCCQWRGAVDPAFAPPFRTTLSTSAASSVAEPGSAEGRCRGVAEGGRLREGATSEAGCDGTCAGRRGSSLGSVPRGSRALAAILDTTVDTEHARARRRPRPLQVYDDAAIGRTRVTVRDRRSPDGLSYDTGTLTLRIRTRARRLGPVGCASGRRSLTPGRRRTSVRQARSSSRSRRARCPGARRRSLWPRPRA